MTKVELYINNVLADIGADFKIRLNRQLISPGELNTKDAQFSYSIGLPPTDTNARIFGYAIVEETRNKFTRVYEAEVIVNGVRIFIGRFRPSDINPATGYKGNLYVPLLKTISEIFGDTPLNKNPPLLLPFGDFVTYVNGYNLAAATAPQYAIFPFVLYGLLPKVPQQNGDYTARDVWDDTVRIGLSDLPPSINPLLMIRHIFNSRGLTINGSAFDDTRLRGLYMSYKNPDDYVQPWNYGQHGHIKLSGAWSSQYNKRSGDAEREYERGVFQSNDINGFPIYAVDLLDATNTRLDIAPDNGDPGSNVSVSNVTDETGRAWVKGQIRVPVTGLYKVQLKADLKIYDDSNFRHTDDYTDVQHLGGTTENANNKLYNVIYEFKLMRDRKSGDFGLSTSAIDGTFYKDNQPQSTEFNDEAIPKYFPQVSAEKGQVNLVDAVQNDKILLGFTWGRRGLNVTGSTGEGFELSTPVFQNPKDLGPDGDEYNEGALAQVLAAKPALAWDGSSTTEEVTRLAIPSKGWWKYGQIGNFDSEGDNPNADLDYSAGPFVDGKIFDAQGNPADAPVGNLADRVDGYYISPLTGFQTPLSGWKCTDYIDLQRWQGVALTGDYDGNAYTAAVTAFYDINKQFIGTGLVSPPSGVTDSYAAEPVPAPSGAAFVRLSEQTAHTITIDATDAVTDNKILARFPLARHFSYVVDANNADYTGKAYLHRGADTAPLLVVDFVGGVASFSTEVFGDTGGVPVLSLYLTTATVNVNGTLTISRQIAEGSEDVIDWELTNKHHIEVINAPTVRARRGFYEGAAEDIGWYGDGQAACVVWLEAGELLTLADVSSEGKYRRDGMHSTYGWAGHEIKYELELEPFRTDRDWLKVDISGNGTGLMDWNDDGNFGRDNIDLVGFLNSELKTDDFLEQFCKALNLRLSQISATEYALDVKQVTTVVSDQYLDLDEIASSRERNNEPLGLPFVYRLGFTIDPDEEGYVVTGEDGGGEYYTGSEGSAVVEQKSTFSYNWYKMLTHGDTPITVPVISKAEVWNPEAPYLPAMLKRYTDQSYRFWYYDGVDVPYIVMNNNGVQTARVTNEIPGASILNYKNKPFTILSNFFRVIVSGDTNYTEVSAYLTPLQYQKLDGSIYARFNGDLYYIAQLSAYDPEALNMTNIKLIRKTQ